MIDEMHRPIDPQADREEGSGYGIGFNVRTKDGYRVVSHSGGMAGVATIMQLFPDRNVAIVVLTNSSSAAPRIIAIRSPQPCCRLEAFTGADRTGNTAIFAHARSCGNMERHVVDARDGDAGRARLSE